MNFTIYSNIVSLCKSTNEKIPLESTIFKVIKKQNEVGDKGKHPQLLKILKKTKK